MSDFCVQNVSNKPDALGRLSSSSAGCTLTSSSIMIDSFELTLAVNRGKGNSSTSSRSFLIALISASSRSFLIVLNPLQSDASDQRVARIDFRSKAFFAARLLRLSKADIWSSLSLASLRLITSAQLIGAFLLDLPVWAVLTLIWPADAFVIPVDQKTVKAAFLISLTSSISQICALTSSLP